MNDLLERLIDEVQKEWCVGGLDSSTMYGEFAIEVAKRAVLAEREACASACDRQAQLQMDTGADDCCIVQANRCARDIRMRSNEKVNSASAAGAKSGEPKANEG